MPRTQSRVIVVFSPTILSLILIRIINSGIIYYTETGNRFNTHLLNRFKKLLKLLNINSFSYNIGVGSFGNGYLNYVYKVAWKLTEEFYDISGDRAQIEKFDQQFRSKYFLNAWKKNMYEKAWEIIVNCLGILNNYDSQSVVYIPKDSYENFIVRKICAERGIKGLKLNIFHNCLENSFSVLVYFTVMLSKLALFGIEFTSKKNRQEFKVMTEAIRSAKHDYAFNLLEWWDKRKIEKEDILFISLDDREPGRVASFKEVKNMGFNCVGLSKNRIPFKHVRDVLGVFFYFPIKNIYLLQKSVNLDFFLIFLLQSYRWFLFFLHYEVKFLITPYDQNTIICNFFGCSTITYHCSYFGALENGIQKCFCGNNLLLWGSAQIEYSKNDFMVDHLYYTGCHGLSYVEGEKKKEVIVGLRGRNLKRKNIVFLDNKVLKDRSTPEELYFRFINLMIRCAKISNSNIYFKPKDPNPFHGKYFEDTNRLHDMKERFDKANITILRDHEGCGAVSAISIADIVVYSMVGTPSMMALMLGVPALTYYDKIDETPDPIMRNYLNEFVFDDQDAIIEKIKKLVSGKEFTSLREEDKKKLNHYLDNKGLARLQHIVSNIVNGHGSSVCGN